MRIDKELIDTWKASVIEIKVDSLWKVIWDGVNCVTRNYPDFVLGNELYVLTAYNPGSMIRDEEINIQANQELLQRITQVNGAQWLESVGRSLSGSHCEYGFAIFGVDKGEIDNLAIEFGQIGYYRFLGTAMEIFAKNSEDEFDLITS